MNSFSYTRTYPKNRDLLLGYLVGVLYGSVDGVREENIVYNGISPDVCERFKDLEAMKLHQLNGTEFERIIKDLNI